MPLSAKQSFVRTWKVSGFHENDLRSTQRTDFDISIWDFVTSPPFFCAAAPSVYLISTLYDDFYLFRLSLVSFLALDANYPHSPSQMARSFPRPHDSSHAHCKRCSHPIFHSPTIRYDLLHLLTIKYINEYIYLYPAAVSIITRPAVFPRPHNFHIAIWVCLVTF